MALDGIAVLRRSVAAIFGQAQQSAVQHRRLCVQLHKLHLCAADTDAAKRPRRRGDTAAPAAGEGAFAEVFLEMLARALPLRKGCVPADRVVAFVGAYSKYLGAQDAGGAIAHENEDEDTLASRFIFRVLRFVLQGFVSKEKNVRFRSVSVIACCLQNILAIDEDLFVDICEALCERASDKEASIRAVVIGALCTLARSSDPEQLTHEEQVALEIIIEAMAYDPSPEVRRAALVGIPLSPSTLPHILARRRDVDSSIRKALYGSVLVEGLLDPRFLNFDEREILVRDGLGDREAAVRTAVGKMLGSWLDATMRDCQTEAGEANVDVIESLSSFAKLFNLSPSGVEAAGTALEALFDSRPNSVKNCIFDDAFWNTLTPESALVARVIVSHRISNTSSEQLSDAAVPSLSVLAECLVDYRGRLCDATDTEGLDLDGADAVLDVEGYQLILRELLSTVKLLDMADEAGRRRIFMILRDLISWRDLPEQLLTPCVDLLQTVVNGEKELVRVVVEVLIDLQDELSVKELVSSQNENGADNTNTSPTANRRDRSLLRSRHPQGVSSEERMKAELIDERCLKICMAMLTHVNATLDEHSTLEGVLKELVAPAVESQTRALRELALVCLTHFTLSSQILANMTAPLLLQHIFSSSEELQVQLLKGIIDALTIYDPCRLLDSKDLVESLVILMLAYLLEHSTSPGVRSVAVLGLAKLVLLNVITDQRILIGLVIAFLSPATEDQRVLRQCLSHFLPLYCFTSTAHQEAVRKAFSTIFDRVLQMKSPPRCENQAIAQLCELYVYWTDPRQARESSQENDIQLNLAIDVLKVMYSPKLEDVSITALASMLGALHIPSQPQDKLLLLANALLIHLPEDIVNQDGNTAKSLICFARDFNKRHRRQLRHIDEENFVDDEDFRAVYKLLGVNASPHEDESATSELGESDHGHRAPMPSFGRSRYSPVHGQGNEGMETSTFPDIPVTEIPSTPRRSRAIQGGENGDPNDAYPSHATPTKKRVAKKRLRSPMHSSPVLPSRKKTQRTGQFAYLA